ncbi:MAG: glutamate racemase [Chlamydiales bacterium]|nr:glutamate racemase [Chlamydiales bacterium]
MHKGHDCIGIFDSGVGGLTVVRQIIDLLPNENIVYFGDTARLPYGSKSEETILRYSIENTVFLMEKNIKLLVIACNTATAFAIEKLKKLFNIPIIGVITPGIERAVISTKNARIGIIGTKGTIQSGAYQRGLQALLPHASIHPIACPLLVHLVEDFSLDHLATRLIIQDYLKPLQEQNIDTLVLGCTHYPLLKKILYEEIGKHICLIDPAITCAQKVQEVLNQNNLNTKQTTPGTREYFVSDDPKKFSTIGTQFLGLPLDSVHHHHLT